MVTDVSRAFQGWMTSERLWALVELSKRGTRLSLTRQCLVCLCTVNQRFHVTAWCLSVDSRGRKTRVQ